MRLCAGAWGWLGARPGRSGAPGVPAARGFRWRTGMSGVCLPACLPPAHTLSHPPCSPPPPVPQFCPLQLHAHLCAGAGARDWARHGRRLPLHPLPLPHPRFRRHLLAGDGCRHWWVALPFGGNQPSQGLRGACGSQSLPEPLPAATALSRQPCALLPPLPAPPAAAGNLPVDLALSLAALVMAFLYMPKAEAIDSPMLQVPGPAGGAQCTPPCFCCWRSGG